MTEAEALLKIVDRLHDITIMLNAIDQSLVILLFLFGMYVGLKIFRK